MKQGQEYYFQGALLFEEIFYPEEFAHLGTLVCVAGELKDVSNGESDKGHEPFALHQKDHSPYGERHSDGVQCYVQSFFVTLFPVFDERGNHGIHINPKTCSVATPDP